MSRTRSLLPVLALLAAAVLIADVRRAAAQAEAPPLDPYAPARPIAKPAKAAKAKKQAKPKAPRSGPADAQPARGRNDGAASGAANGATNEAPVDPYEELPTPTDVPVVTIPPRLGIGELPAMQGLFAVQRLDGWLLQDRDGQSAVALQLVAPIYRPAGPWYYLLPASGEPVLISQPADAAAFEKLAGRKVVYQNDRELQRALRDALKGKKTLAMELALAGSAAEGKALTPARPAKPPKDVVRDTLRALKIRVVSSDQLVQYTTAVWGQAGHTAHHVAVHHLIELRKEALAFIAKQLRAGAAVSELDVQQRLQRGMAMRGVVGPAPGVAAGVQTADSTYVPTPESSAAIREGDLISISLALRLDRPDGVFAAQTWVAYAGASAPERVVKLFDSVTLARDQAIALIAERYRQRRPLRGYEVDALVRATLTKAGLGKQLRQRTGHSIGTTLDGTGANLDEHGVKDTRSLVAGTGVTVAPGVYFDGELGVRSEVTLFLSPGGPEITTPPQLEVEALLAP